jgi:hypothetical protein
VGLLESFSAVSKFSSNIPSLKMLPNDWKMLRID